jgi:hypothetical protein
MRTEDFRWEVERTNPRKRGGVGTDLFQGVPAPNTSYRAGDQDCRSDAGVPSDQWVLSGNDLCRFPRGGESGQRRSREAAPFHEEIFSVSVKWPEAGISQEHQWGIGVSSSRVRWIPFLMSHCDSKCCVVMIGGANRVAPCPRSKYTTKNSGVTRVPILRKT